MEEMDCYICDNGRDKSITEFDLCKECWDKKLVMSKTTGKKEYMLNDKDLEGLPVKYFKTAYRSIGTLYLEEDLKDKAIKKYGDIGRERKSREDKAKRRIIKQRENKEKRKKILEKELIKRGCTLRSDSTLCKLFINGSKKMDVHTVAEIMEQMKFYFDHTNYDDILSKMIEDEKEYQGYFDIDECRDCSKSSALDEYKKKWKSDCCKMMLIPESLR